MVDYLKIRPLSTAYPSIDVGQRRCSVISILAGLHEFNKIIVGFASPCVFVPI